MLANDSTVAVADHSTVGLGQIVLGGNIIHGPESCQLTSIPSHLVADGISNVGVLACLNISRSLFLVHCSHGHPVSLPVYLFVTLSARAMRSSLTGKSVKCF